MRNLGFEKQLIHRLTDLAKKVTDSVGRRILFMEVCGTHTMAISTSGLRTLLAEHMELRSGPGCPVCVTDQGDIDRIIAMARIQNMVIATFGDMVRVPGTHSSLERERAKGARIEVCYSPLDAVAHAEKNPGFEVVFAGVGFETTTPVVALAVERARRSGIRNFSVLSFHKLVPPAMKAILNDPELKADGFLLPGHVCTITGRKAFDFIAADYRTPSVIAGFEPVDIMQSIYMLLGQMLDGTSRTLNGYTRLVRETGNRKALGAMNMVFEGADAPWRGFGVIPDSGLSVRSEYSDHDARRRFPIAVPESRPPDGCSCGDVLKGKLLPPECPLFGSVCTPTDPVGPCMVSSEGACAAYLKTDS